MSESSIESRFGRGLAIVIGIGKYESGIPLLETGANDARGPAVVWADRHRFEVRLLLDEDASRERPLGLLTDTVQEWKAPVR